MSPADPGCLRRMTTFALIHGSGDGGWAWHLVERALRERGHRTVAPDLPTHRDDATWTDCAEAVAAALGSPDEGGHGEGVVLVGHSSGGLVVPLAASRPGVVLQVFVAGMVPQPGETPGEWFDHLGWSEAVAEQAREDGGLTGSPDPLVLYFHDVPSGLAAEARARERPIGGTLGETPWPLSALPAIPARYVVTARDRFLPPAVQRRAAAERLGIAEPDELASGHCASLSRPEELAAMLAGYARAT